MLTEMKGFVKYSSRMHQASQIWLPGMLTVLMMIVIGLFSKFLKPVEVSSAFTGVVLPLIGGIMAAYSTLDDPSLELQFSTPRSALAILLNRFLLVLVVLSVCSLAFQLFIHWIGVDVSSFGSVWQRQLNWIIPCLACTSLGFFAAFSAAQCNTGGIAVGLVWILQVIAREWFLNTPVARQLFLFAGALYPTAPTVHSSQVVLLITSILLLAASWRLLHQQERYI